MRYAIVQNGIVSNAIEAEPDFADSIGAIQSDDAQIGWTWDGEVFAPPPGPSFEALSAAKLAALAERRWQAETGGTIVAGMPIKTDAESTGKITAAYVQATANPAFTVRWKVDTGVFVTLDAATIIAIGDAVTAHAQACFDNEDVLTAAILAAEDAPALDAIDIDAGWPS